LAKKATAKTVAKKKTRNFLFNSIHTQLERLELVMSSAAAENIDTSDLIFMAAMLQPISMYAAFAAGEKHKKKTPRVAARRKG
jgi:hypothetical protein